MTNRSAENAPGAQRLSLAKLHEWQNLGLGMFFHFGMSTFDGEELSDGQSPSSRYAPDRLDLDQWLAVAVDTGAKYAVLTAKHTSGHCLWPSAHTDYHVGTSGNPTDVVAEFVAACARHQIVPGLYYCAWDNHHRFGSVTPSDALRLSGDLFGGLTFNDGMPHTIGGSVWRQAPYTTAKYREFVWNQISELLTGYGPIGEFWLDIPGLLPRDFREDLYAHMAALQPEMVIMANHGIGDGSSLDVSYAWPTDLIAIERALPDSHRGHVPWREVAGKKFYLPAEVCDPVGREWFFSEGDRPRSDAELLGMYLVARSRGANLLLDVGPDRSGRIPAPFAGALGRLGDNIRAQAHLLPRSDIPAA